ncbi:hypothetical protein BFW01_g6361 [Lasiodiplodia theobromae]|nr:hypothetical protein BFW01_g6361 [Lasiodiplodia theobromae]
MCNYRYIYYSRCQHADFTLVDFCDKAYERAGLAAPHPRDTKEDVYPPFECATNIYNHTSGQAAGQEKHDADTSFVDQRAEEQDMLLQQPVRHAVASQQTPPTTWASIARTAMESNSGSVAQGCTTPSSSLPSPAQRLAARLDSAAAGSDSSTQTFQPASEGWGDENANRSRWVGRGTYRGRRKVTGRGRSGSDQTVRPTKRAASKHETKDFPETGSASLDLHSSAQFPLLSPTKPASVSPRARASSTSSWAQIARLFSADRPDSSSTSDPTAASDAAIPAIPAMAPTRGSGATLDFRRPQPPTHRPDSPRKPLPTEWTAGLSSASQKSAPVLTGRKSLGNLGRQPKAAHDGSTITPKSPTKVVPFQLATARRAAAREQKDKAPDTTKLVPAIPKALPPSKTASKTHSKAASSDTTSNSQYRTAAASPFPSGSSQSFATAHEDVYHALPPPASPSRIPRLVAIVDRNRAPRTSGSEPSPVRSEARNEITVSETASEPPVDIQRTPFPAAPPIQNFDITGRSNQTAKLGDEDQTPTASNEKRAESTVINAARSEITKSDEAIAKASAAVAELQHAEHLSSHVHFTDTPEDPNEDSGLGIGYGPSGFSSESPSFHAKSPIASSIIHPDATSTFAGAGYEGASVEREQSKEKSIVEDSKHDDTRSPETINTWPESTVSLSRETDLESVSLRSKASGTGADSEEGTRGFAEDEVVGSETSFTEDQSSSSRPNESSQWSLHSLRSGSSSAVSTIKGSGFASPSNPPEIETSKRVSVPPHLRRHFRGNATTPSRLNAQAQEFVPGSSDFSNPFLATTSYGAPARLQVPPQWMATTYPPGETLPTRQPTTEPTEPTGWKNKKKKKSPKKNPDDHGDLWDRSSDRDMSAYSRHASRSSSMSGPYGTVPGRFGTTVPQYGVSVGPPDGGWGVPNAAQSLGSAGAFRAINNVWYGRRSQAASQPSREPYLGRGGRGLPTPTIPKGDDPVEKWWHGELTSINGGPLTHGAAYDYLRKTENAREKYPTIFAPEAKEYVGYGMLKTCGHVQMVGAFEALPHYPLLCPKCQPDDHPRMSS